MIVLMEGVDKPRSGKGHFLLRLKNEMQKIGVDVVHNPKYRHDVSLHCIRMWCKTPKPRILRVDGIYHNIDQNYRQKNHQIAVSAEKADGVICQSYFGQEMAVRYIRLDRKKSVIIPNGAPVIDAKKKRDIFLTASRWRPHKRLEDTIEAYLMSGVDTPLYVVGNTDDSGLKKNYTSKKIIWLGPINNGYLCELYDRAVALIHLCWFDCCPNVVVEALAHYCPVITNNVGGTKELLDGCGGTIVPIDAPYDYRPVHLYKPPAIDRALVAAAIRHHNNTAIKVNTRFIDIKNVARQYVNYLGRFV